MQKRTERRDFVFPLAVGGCLVAAEMFLSLFFMSQAPAGFRWIGVTMQNNLDLPVYLSYINQIADGSVTVDNLYAVEHHLRRFDPVWFLLGTASRAGLPPLWAHELGRWLFTFCLVFAIFQAARLTFDERRTARWATILALGGTTTGALVLPFIALPQGLFEDTVSLPPDLMSELAPHFAFVAGGAHIALSMALLVATLATAWRSMESGSLRAAAVAAGCGGFLLVFHPYFVPLLAMYLVFSFLFQAFARRRLVLRPLVVVSLAFILPAVMYVPLAFDKVFMDHNFGTNSLPLHTPLLWLLTFLPTVIALSWRGIRGKRLSSKEYWLIAWLMAAGVCLLVPFPWKRKLTESLSVGCLFLSMPAWMALGDWLKRRLTKTGAIVAIAALVLAAWCGPIFLYTRNIAWARDPAHRYWFYMPDGLFRAWEFIRADASADAVTLSDHLLMNLWSPAFALRRTWIGHAHETPNFRSKYLAWSRIMTEDVATAVAELETTPVTIFVVSDAANRLRFSAPLLSRGWASAYRAGDAEVFVRP